VEQKSIFQKDMDVCGIRISRFLVFFIFYDLLNVCISFWAFAMSVHSTGNAAKVVDESWDFTCDSIVSGGVSMKYISM